MASKIRSICSAPLISIAFLLLSSLLLALSEEYSEHRCETVELVESLDLVQMAGDWYVVVRSPPSTFPACVHIIAPATFGDGYYSLQVEYVNSFGSTFKRIKETLIFPLADAKRGLFTLENGVKWQILPGENSRFIELCGYGKDPNVKDFGKMITRDRDSQDPEIKHLMKIITNRQDDLSLVEQSSKCNGAAALIPTMMGLLISVLVLAASS